MTPKTDNSGAVILVRLFSVALYLLKIFLTLLR